MTHHSTFGAGAPLPPSVLAPASTANVTPPPLPAPGASALSASVGTTMGAGLLSGLQNLSTPAGLAAAKAKLIQTQTVAPKPSAVVASPTTAVIEEVAPLAASVAGWGVAKYAFGLALLPAIGSGVAVGALAFLGVKYVLPKL